MRSESIDQLAAALAAAQGEFSAVPKTDTNPFFKSKYAPLSEVVKTAAPVLSKHGLAVSQFPSGDIDGSDTEGLYTYLMHSSGQFVVHAIRLHLPKEDPQGQGSAITYARRYAYMAVLGLVADEDDDGNRASQAPAKEESRTRRAPNQMVSANTAKQTLIEQAKQCGVADTVAAAAKAWGERGSNPIPTDELGQLCKLIERSFS